MQGKRIYRFLIKFLSSSRTKQNRTPQPIVIREEFPYSFPKTECLHRIQVQTTPTFAGNQQIKLKR